MALDLVENGVTSAATGQRLGVPKSTIDNWRRGRLPTEYQLHVERRLCTTCREAHDLEALPSTAYAYLLGLYLGDGCLVRHERCWSLRLYMDAAYPEIVAESRVVMATISREGEPP